MAQPHAPRQRRLVFMLMRRSHLPFQHDRYLIPSSPCKQLSMPVARPRTRCICPSVRRRALPGRSQQIKHSPSMGRRRARALPRPSCQHHSSPPPPHPHTHLLLRLAHGVRRAPCVLPSAWLAPAEESRSWAPALAPIAAAHRLAPARQITTLTSPLLEQHSISRNDQRRCLGAADRARQSQAHDQAGRRVFYAVDNAGQGHLPVPLSAGQHTLEVGHFSFR